MAAGGDDDDLSRRRAAGDRVRGVPSGASSSIGLPTRRLFSLTGHVDPVVSLLAHPFLPLLVSGSGVPEATVRVWDLETRSLLCTLTGHTGYIFGLALDQVGVFLASTSEDNTLRLWDLDSGTCCYTLEGHSGGVAAVAWDSTGSLIASGSYDRTVRVWDAASGALRHILEGHAGEVYALAAHPFDDLLASGSGDSTVRIWRWTSSELVRTLEGHADAVTSLAASVTWLVSGSGDKSVRVWSWASGECARVLDGFAGKLYSNSLSWRDSMLVLLESDEDDEGDGTVRVWDTSSPDPPEWSCVGSLPSKASFPCGVAVAGTGWVACTAPGEWTTIALWGLK